MHAASSLNILQFLVEFLRDVIDPVGELVFDLQ